MPGPSLHLHLIDATIERWQANGGAPVRLGVDGALAALRMGAVAPDMGYYPGGEPLLTDLAHYVRSGDLARALLARADTAEERAFAWGWTSHVEADALIHPAINRAAGALRGVDRAQTYADDPSTHVRLEIGLDAVVDGRYGTPALEDPHRWAPLVTRACEYAYDLRLEQEAVARTLAAGARFHRIFVGVVRLNRRSFQARGPGSWISRAVLWKGAVLARAVSAATMPALFRGVAPPTALLDAVKIGVGRYHVRMEERVATGLADLPNYNLDTGAEDEAASSYPLTLQTQRQLNAHRGS